MPWPDASAKAVLTARTVFPFLETSLVNSGFERSHSVFSRVVVHYYLNLEEPVLFIKAPIIECLNLYIQMGVQRINIFEQVNTYHPIIVQPQAFA